MSKELKALAQLKQNYKDETHLFDDELLAIIEPALKALEIIKEKNVNVGDFKRCKSSEDYNAYCCYSEKEQLTEEEYDLLKEVLK